MKFEGATAIVTGAASGLGAATVAELTARGTNVVGIDLAAGPGVVAADVTSEADIQSVLDGLDGPPLRIVVNCAGIAPARKLLSSKGIHELELFRRAIEVNLLGSFNVMRLAAAVIAESPAGADGQRGVIVNTASIAGYEGQIGQTAYAASKGGVIGMTLPAARDLAAYGIRVNTIAPGIVDTPMLAGLGTEVNESLAAVVPFPHRLARPDEYAQLVAMIVEHDYLNGETIRMDGALRLGPA